MTKREGFKSLAERLGIETVTSDLVSNLDAMFTELREELCVAPSRAEITPDRSEIVALPCIVCRRDLAGCAVPNQPLDGIAFQSRGAYGTTLFDPMDGSYLEINICDQCLLKAGRADRVFHYPTAPVDMRGAPTIWGRADGGVGLGPTSRDELSASQDELKSTPAKTPEPEVTERMLLAGGLARPGISPDRLREIYLSMRFHEPQRPVEITEETVVRAHMAYVMTRDATSESPPRRVMVAMRAALEAALNHGDA